MEKNLTAFDDVGDLKVRYNSIIKSHYFKLSHISLSNQAAHSSPGWVDPIDCNVVLTVTTVLAGSEREERDERDERDEREVREVREVTRSDQPGPHDEATAVSGATRAATPLRPVSLSLSQDLFLFFLPS